MKQDRTAPEIPASHVAVTDSADDLATIREPGCAAAIWNRTPSEAFQTWIDALPLDQWPRGRTVFRADDAHSFVANLLAGQGVPNNGHAAVLAEDMAAICGVFAKIMNATFLKMRVEVVTGNACRKFHLDVMEARLICTYRGEGTQYGVSANGDAPEQVFSVPTGAHAIFRGSEWRDGAPPKLLHRSPPIEGTGETRFVMVLDPAMDPASEGRAAE